LCPSVKADPILQFVYTHRSILACILLRLPLVILLCPEVLPFSFEVDLFSLVEALTHGTSSGNETRKAWRGRHQCFRGCDAFNSDILHSSDLVDNLGEEILHISLHVHYRVVKSQAMALESVTRTDLTEPRGKTGVKAPTPFIIPVD
jgi:hypothetical protein